MFELAIFLSCIALCAGVRVAVVDNRNEQPSNATAYIVDTQHKSATPFTHGLDGAKVYVSGACICNGTYYAVQTDFPSSYGLVAIDIASGEVSELDTNYLLHAIWCDPANPGSLLAVGSHPNPPFELFRYNTKTQEATQIIEFPTKDWGGYDQIFHYVPKANEVWASFPKSKRMGGGELFIADPSTGSMKGSYNFSTDLAGDIPYVMFPDDGGMANTSFNGVMMVGPLTENLHFAHLSLDGNKVDVHRVIAVDWFFSSSLPDEFCSDGNVYVTTNEKRLVGMDPHTGKQVLDMDLSELINIHDDVAGLACV